MSIRFGIIGTNWITESFIQAASMVEEFTLAAVYSRSKEKGEAFAQKYNAEHIFTSLTEMAESDQVDAVYIASPNSLHAEQSILFLKNKKHVLTEKAFASNVKEAEIMISVAKENNVLLMEALKTTMLPNFKVIQENIHKIGKVRRAFASYCQYSSRYDAYKEGNILNAFKPEFSNGALMDIGVYCIYPMVALFGKPQSVKASSYLLESGVDGEGSIIMTYKDMDIVLMYSKITNSLIPSEIQGEDGNILIDQMNTPQKIEIAFRNGEREDVSVQQKEEAMYYEAKEFIDTILAGKTESSINSLDLSLAVMEVMEEVRKQTGIVFPADKK
ncbi:MULTISPECIES: Gfo/Idh/MocA family oxidoreductase [Bacillaceae]|uniref:Gfo/Idh/MocA family protein n=1 Tax=Bacillaceae TaxID=186817 RepID=UPI001E32A48E|nr:MULTISPECIES: Gfo/Idh/MocA family oxidoreductase [Bacillaceae]MCE4050650.1 Gfo/Idh/MocA family oxidoreductase [Bacillus sp. Au-Bac7]MCM3031950.1 Gfo/Idh/MocA family oxidoreductase [Niallia sp. MER 6]MDL0436045.1 Gfo/Idh/MocA family oxidoreductase [Niallia sp. SS-2023]UPO87906.1 Gfo/Idh/MocA family oxidoreductase [Niallia sp. Man26]